MTAPSSSYEIGKSSSNLRELIEDILEFRVKECGYLFISSHPSRSVCSNGALKRSSLTVVSTFGTLIIIS